MTEAQFVKEAREKAGLTQGQVAKKLKYTSPQFISNVERGKCFLPLKKVRPFCKVTKADLFKYIDIKADHAASQIHKLAK